MDKQQIGKYVALGLIVLAFAGIILGISRIFASKCSSGYTFYKDQNKCIKDCESGYHYSNPNKNDWTCIPKCDSGQDYFPAAKKCSACAPGAIDSANNALVRHPSCKGGGVASCGADCSKRKLSDPTGQDQNKKDPRTAQVFDCETGRCKCQKPYELCGYYKGDPNGVCYDPRKAFCVCGSSSCQVTPCTNICGEETADGDGQIHCCQEDGMTCCPKDGRGSSVCCPKDARCNEKTGACCDKDSQDVQGHCCSPDKIYCGNDAATPPTLDKDNNKLTCPDGVQMECCLNDLCITGEGPSRKVKCCNPSEGIKGCGNTSLCGMDPTFPKMAKNSKLNGRCMGAIPCSKTKDKTKDGYTCMSCAEAPKNHVCVCVNPGDYFNSTFADPTNNKCAKLGERAVPVIWQGSPPSGTDPNTGTKCSRDSQCAGYSNVNKSCYSFDPKTLTWEEKLTEECSSNAKIAYKGECLTGCGGEPEIYCPSNATCLTDKGSGTNYCEGSIGKFVGSTTWPGDLDIDGKEKPMWAQVYTPELGQKYCPVGAITCALGDKDHPPTPCPLYHTLDGVAKPLTCVHTDGDPDGQGRCLAPVEYDLETPPKPFCRVNYSGPELPAGQSSYDGDLVNLSLLGNNALVNCRYFGDESTDCETAGCTATNFGHRDSKGNNVYCGYASTISSQAFPFWTNSTKEYEGPLKNTPKHDLSDVWGCGQKDGNQSTIAQCGQPGEGEGPFLYGQLSTLGEKAIAAVNNNDGWSLYRTVSWTKEKEENPDANDCYSQAMAHASDDQVPIRITWNETSGECKAQYAPKLTKGVCEYGKGNTSCISYIEDEKKSPQASGLICPNDPTKWPRTGGQWGNPGKPGFLGLTDPNCKGPGCVGQKTPDATTNGVYTCGTVRSPK